MLEQVSLGAKICCVYKLSKRTGEKIKKICLHTNSIASAAVYCEIVSNQVRILAVHSTYFDK